MAITRGQTQTEIRERAFIGRVKDKMHVYGYDSAKELAPSVGLTYPQLTRRFSKPDTFKPSELYKLYNVLHFTDDERLILVR